MTCLSCTEKRLGDFMRSYLACKDQYYRMDSAREKIELGFRKTEVRATRATDMFRLFSGTVTRIAAEGEAKEKTTSTFYRS